MVAAMENSCCSCLKPSATLQCGICKDSVCKKCAQFLGEDSFSFLEKVSEELSHNVYCPQCFDAKVVSALEAYNETMERAKNLAVYLKDQSKETRLMSRKAQPVQVLNCADREETLLRLAFLAANAGFNCLVDVDLTSKKIREGSYQTQSWSGTAVPVQVTGRRR